jgi:hypothetical protein
MRLHYKDQPASAVYGNKRCLLWESYETHKHTVWVKKQFFNVKECGTYGYNYHCIEGYNYHKAEHFKEHDTDAELGMRNA